MHACSARGLGAWKLASYYKVSVAIMGHLRTLQYYYSKEAYRDFNFNPDTHHLIYFKPHKNEVQRII